MTSRLRLSIGSQTGEDSPSIKWDKKSNKEEPERGKKRQTKTKSTVIHATRAVTKVHPRWMQPMMYVINDESKVVACDCFCTGIQNYPTVTTLLKKSTVLHPL